jgi:hypothetical protein
MFNKIGYGIFVLIENSNLQIFKPFVNIYNEKKLGKYSITNKNIKFFVKRKLKDLNIPQDKHYYHKIMKERKAWGFSKCNFFYWSEWWKDMELYLNIYFNMLETILKDKTTNINTCFFINLLDEPVLLKKKCESIISHDLCLKNSKININQSNFIPVLSAVSSNDHYDKCLVYPDAWELASQKKFGSSCRDMYYKKKVNKIWTKKTNTIIFRGRNNSCYPNNFEKNIRLKVLKILNKIKASNKSVKIDINTGLSSYSISTLFTNGKLVSTKPTKNLDYLIKNSVDMISQSKCKFILDMDGYATPWRLCFELSYKSCIILVKSKYFSWFYDKLENKNNIIILDAYSKNLKNDLKTTLLELQDNEKLSKKVANNSYKLYKSTINVKSITDYMLKLLSSPEFNILNNDN